MLVKLNTPEGCTECSHDGIPYPLDDARQITVPEEVAPFFLGLNQGFSRVVVEAPAAAEPANPPPAPPNPPAPSKRAASTSEA